MTRDDEKDDYGGNNGQQLYVQSQLIKLSQSLDGLNDVFFAPFVGTQYSHELIDKQSFVRNSHGRNQKFQFMTEIHGFFYILAVSQELKDPIG